MGIKVGAACAVNSLHPLKLKEGNLILLRVSVIFPVPPLHAELGSHPNCLLPEAFHNEPVGDLSSS